MKNKKKKKSVPRSVAGMALPGSLKELYKKAVHARKNAYSPYSGFSVGAAVRLESGEIFVGCNVENSSFGATVCAERVAIQSAIAHRGAKTRIAEVLVVTDAEPAWPPCGMCRQVIAEFGRHASIHAVNLKGEVRSTTLSQLLPEAFLPEHLEK
jgi:cytidine deaminase